MSLQETILEEEERVRHENKYLLVTLRVIANILVIIVLTSSTYAIYEVVERSTDVDARVRAGESVGWIEQNMVIIKCWSNKKCTNGMMTRPFLSTWSNDDWAVLEQVIR